KLKKCDFQFGIAVEHPVTDDRHEGKLRRQRHAYDVAVVDRASEFRKRWNSSCPCARRAAACCAQTHPTQEGKPDQKAAALPRCRRQPRRERRAVAFPRAPRTLRFGDASVTSRPI